MGRKQYDWQSYYLQIKLEIYTRLGIYIYIQTISFVMSNFNITIKDDSWVVGSAGHFATPPQKNRRLRTRIKKYNTRINYERTYVKILKYIFKWVDEEGGKTNKATIA